MSLTPAARDVVVRLMDGYVSTQLLYVAAQLNLADLLANGPRSTEELAAAAGADRLVLHRLLRGLAITGIVDEEPLGVFSLTEAGRYLQSDNTASLRGAVLSRGDLYYCAAAGLLQSVRTGGTAFRHVYGTELFDQLAASPERLVAFQESMVARAQVEAKELLAAYDFSRFHHVVDVGGGFGVTLTAVLTAYPELRATLFDRPEVVRAAQPRLDAAGVTPRCTVVAGDAFEAVPPGGDLYLLSRVVHDWNDDDAARILGSCRTAMGDPARLALVEAVIADRASDDPAAIWMDLHMLVLGKGRERTRGEFDELLARAGFRLQRVVPTHGSTGISVLEATCM